MRPLVAALLVLLGQTLAAQIDYTVNVHSRHQNLAGSMTETVPVAQSLLSANCTGNCGGVVNPPANPADTVTISDTSGTTQTNRPITIPRAFKQGEISQFAQASIGGGVGPVLTQCDVKNRWPDGSVKFAMVSFLIPTITPGIPVVVTFQNQASGNNTTFLPQADMLAANFNFDAQIQLTGTASPTISARTMLTNNDFIYWLQGPIVTAIILEDKLTRKYDVNTDGVGTCPVTGGANCPLHPQFEAWFYPQSNTVEIGYTLENTWISSTTNLSMRDQTYSLVLTDGQTSPTTVLSQASFNHIGRSRWHEDAILHPAPTIHIDYNSDYELTTAAFPDWDPNLVLSSSLISNYHTTFNSNAAVLTIPGGSTSIGNFSKDINGTGQHDYVGLANLLDILYFLSMNDNLRSDMLLNASLAGRIPFHYREADSHAGTGQFFDSAGTVPTQGRVMSINARRQMTLGMLSGHFNETVCGSSATPDLVSLGATSFDGWSYDASHFPSIGYMTYLLSGKYYYAEELQYEAAYIIGEHRGCIDSGGSNRQGSEGYLNQGQERGQAWGMRTMGYCAFIEPDSDPVQAYCFDKLKNNISELEGGMSNEPISAPSYSDKQTEYNWGKLTWGGSDTPPPTNPNSSSLGMSPLHVPLWSNPVYVENPLLTPAGCAATGCLDQGGSPWEDAFMANSMGIMRNQGFLTTNILKRFYHLFVNLALNTGTGGLNSPYYIDIYRYPTVLTATHNWVQTWPQFTQSFAAQVAGSAPNGYQSIGLVMDDAHGFQAMCALSYGTDLTIDGYSVLTAFNTVKQNHPFESQFATDSPKWDCLPITNSSTTTNQTAPVTENTIASDTVTGIKTPTGPQTFTRTLTETYPTLNAPLGISVNGASRNIGWFPLANTVLTTSGACPPNYYGGDTFNFATACPTSITAQSGGFVDTDHNQVCVWGEGHNDGYGNEVMCVDLTANPPAWKLRTNPTIPTNCQAATNVTGGLCPGFTPAHNACLASIPPQNPWPTSGTPGTECLTNGGVNCAPNSRHSYANMEYMPGFAAFLHGGVASCQAGGSGVIDTWLFNTTNNTWSYPTLTFVNTGVHTTQCLSAGNVNCGIPQESSGVYTTAWDSANKLLWMDTMDGSYGSASGNTHYLFSFDPTSNTYNLRFSENSYSALYMEAVVDPVDHYLFEIGACAYAACNDTTPTHYGIIRYDLSNLAAITKTNITASTTGCANLYQYNGVPGDSKPNDLNIGLAWDPVWKLIVAWPNFGDSVYLFNPAAATVTTPFGSVPQNTCLEVTNAFLGSGPPDSGNVGGVAATSYGTYHRFGYLPTLDEFVLVNSPSSNAYVLKLR